MQRSFSHWTKDLRRDEAVRWNHSSSSDDLLAFYRVCPGLRKPNQTVVGLKANRGHLSAEVSDRLLAVRQSDTVCWFTFTKRDFGLNQRVSV